MMSQKKSILKHTPLQVILGHCGYASFGTTPTVVWDYRILPGKKDHENAIHLMDLTIHFTLTMSFLLRAKLVHELLTSKIQSSGMCHNAA